MSNVVLFTGLPRNTGTFRTSIEELDTLRHEGVIDDIKFVTWYGYLDEKPELLDFLDENNIKVIEREESSIGGPGNIWHQMKALDIGLHSVPDDAWVLKTRTDVHIKQDFVRRLFNGSLQSVREQAGSDVFDYRVWVPWFIVTQPFAVNDQCFFGTACDLEQLVNYSVRIEVYDYSRNAHVRRFIEPYLDEFEFLQSLLSFSPVNKDLYELYRKRIKAPVYGSFLAFYYKVMMEDFYVDHSPMTFYKQWDEGPDRPPHKPIEPLNDEDFMVNYSKEYAKQYDDQWVSKDTKNVYCYREAWLQSHFDGEWSSDIPEPLREGIGRPFEEWRAFELDDKQVQMEIKTEQRHRGSDVSYPRQQYIRWLYTKVLKPLGLDTVSKRGYEFLYRLVQ